MKPAAVIMFLFLSSVTTFSNAGSLFNCGNGKSASIGDLKQQVRLSCGEPERIELIGFIDTVQNKERIRVMKIEEWIYQVSHYGKKQYYSLTFEGNALVKIQPAGSR